MSINSFPLAHLNAKFILDDHIFDISKFKVKFEQSKDYKGQPQHETKGGYLFVTLSQTPKDNLYLWAKTSTLTKSGEIHFQTDLGITVLRIHFSNAYCVNLERNGSALTGTETTLLISSEIISLNGIEHDNFW